MANNEQPREVRQGLVGSSISLLNKIISVLIISLILSIIFEWIGITWFWPEQGYLHSYNMMLSESNLFTASFTQSLLHSSPGEFAKFIVAKTHEYLFVKTGLSSWLVKSHKNESVAYYIYHYGRAYIEAIIYVTITFVIRVLIILFTSPLFILAAIVGITDGLVRRDIRRFGCGYESSFVYHHAKSAILPTVILAWMIYLSVPFSIHPNFILLPAALLLGVSISIAAASFKKYL